MPAELAWTRKMPTVPGLYIERRYVGETRITQTWKVYLIGDDLCAHSDDLGTRGPFCLDMFDGEFLGPLPE